MLERFIQRAQEVQRILCPSGGQVTPETWFVKEAVAKLDQALAEYE